MSVNFLKDNLSINLTNDEPVALRIDLNFLQDAIVSAIDGECLVYLLFGLSGWAGGGNYSRGWILLLLLLLLNLLLLFDSGYALISFNLKLSSFLIKVSLKLLRLF